MAFAYGTTITTPNGTTAIEELNIGDTASAWTPNGTEPKAVVFSNGTRDGYPADGMIFLRLGDDELIVTHDQPIAVAGNKIKKAAQLLPGRDHLLQANGQFVQLVGLQSGSYSGGLHSIAVGTFDNTGNHLIIANGIVCGDYVMAVMLSPSDDDYEMPFIGEKE